MARPTKLTPQVQQNIVDALMAGNYFDAACAYAGITDRAGYYWMERGRKELERREGNVKEGTKRWLKEEPFVQFLQAVKKADSHAEVKNVALIQKAANETWQAAAWWLERRFPQKWGRKVMEHQGKDGGAIETEVTHKFDPSKLSDDELKRILEK